MFFKNNMRPAYATASAAGQAPTRKVRNDAFTYAEASETEDFGSYSSNTSGNNSRRNTGKSSKKINPLFLGIGIGAVVAVILLVVLIVALVGGGRGDDIKYQDNTFISFADADGIWRVAANGKIVGEYENKVSLITADDRSFAYIIEESEDGYRITVTDGKDVTEITPSPVSKILATAGLVPGVVWLDSLNGVYLYTDKGGEERITKDVNSTLANTDQHRFMISADARTVVYTKLDADKPGEVHYLCVYRDSSETRFQKNMYPEAISDDGSLIYASALSKDAITKSLYVLPFTDENDRYLLSEHFYSIVDINTTGNEVVFTTISDTDPVISTHVVAFNVKKMDEVASPVRIGKGAVYAPANAEPDVARYATFADTYFEAQVAGLDIVDGQAPVYYVNKNFEIRRISKFSGKFTPDGDYFYYTNNEGTLQRIDLSDDDSVSEKIADDILEFEITQKGNVYWLDDTTRLMFLDIAGSKVNEAKRTRIADNVESISMHTYSNTLYFTYTDTFSIQSTKEGSEKEAAKFDGTAVVGIPQFVNPDFEKTFVAFYDSENEEWQLFYTSNGKRFSLVATCEMISGFSVDIDLDDILDSIIPDTNNTTDTSIGTDTAAQ